MTRIFVWDGAMRLFHWLLVTGFLVAYFTPERATTIHVLAGYLVVTLLVVRLVYGFAGTEHARFRDFLPDPRGAMAHVRGLMRGEPRHTAGHNPTSALGAWALLILIAGTVLTAALPIEALHPLHGVFADLAVAAAVLHVIGLIIEDALTGEGIIASMVHGFKTMPETIGQKMHASAPTQRGLVGGTLAAVVVALILGLGTGTLNWPLGEEEHEHEEEHGEEQALRFNEDAPVMGSSLQQRV